MPARIVRSTPDHSRSDLGGVEEGAALLGRLQLGEIGLRRCQPRPLLGRFCERNGPRRLA
jgi:hypothetical protein